VRVTFAAGLCLALSLSAFTPAAAKSDGIETAGQAIAIALPVVAGGISIYKNDWTGLAEMTVATGATVGTAYGLKYIVHEQRPDHSDDKSFPSDTAALAFAPANFLWQRYGWQYGLPAYLAAGFVGYSRVEAKQHHWWDVVASAGLAFGYNEIFTTRYVRRRGVYSSLYATPRSVFVSLNYNW
jgi:PAP2 superfamily